ETEDPSQTCWEFVEQASGDLGDRMLGWFQQAASKIPADGDEDEAPSEPDSTRFSEHAILIGSDCPTVTPHTIDRAVQHLRRNEIVVGPAIDGGYYLIGMQLKLLDRARCLFANVPWSTDQVLSCTLRQAEQSGLSIGLLEPKSDIDTLEDLFDLRDFFAATSRSEYSAMDKKIEAILEEAYRRNTSSET
ncbi:MAG: TIGR04282 family arsenosugar biosynthesis glycosyltransferase, partial [Planctomycetota bacterium]